MAKQEATVVGLRRWVPLKELAAEHLDGASVTELARKYGVTHQAISKRLRAIPGMLERDETEAFEAYRVRVLTALEKQMVTLLGQPERQAKASLNNVAYAFTQVHQARRLEEGQSTANVGLHVLIEDLARQARAKVPETPDVVVEAQEQKAIGGP